MRSLSTLIVAVALLVACSQPGTPAGLPNSAPTNASTSPTPSPAPEPTPAATRLACNDSYPRQIPDGRMLKGGTEMCLDGESTGQVLPKLCASATPGFSDVRVAHHMISETISSGPAPTMVAQTVLTFPNGGGAAYLAKVRAVLASCPSHTAKDKTKITYSSGDGPSAGQESLSLKALHQYPQVEGMPSKSTLRIMLARCGDTVSVIYDHGWEGAPSLDQTIFDAAKEGARLICA